MHLPNQFNPQFCQATAEPPPAPKPEAQPTLRVMRLYKPRLHFSPATPYSAQVDALSANSGATNTSGPSATTLLGRLESDCSLSSCLILPDSFGSIHRGETFCAYVSVLNHLPASLRDVKVSAKLVTPQSKRTLVLADARQERGAVRAGADRSPLLSSGDKLDMVVQSTLSELGDYTLRVTVEYADPSPPPPPISAAPGYPGSSGFQPSNTGGVAHPNQYITPVQHSSGYPGAAPRPLSEPMQAATSAAATPPAPRVLRKFYKFKVCAPVEVNSVARVVSGKAFVQVEVRSTATTASQFVLSGLHFAAAAGLVATEIAGLSGNSGGSGAGAPAVVHRPPPDSSGSGGKSLVAAQCSQALDRTVLLGPGESRQFLFQVEKTLHPSASTGPDLLDAPHSPMQTTPLEPLGQLLGAVHVQWRSAMAETGSFKTGPVHAPVARRREVEVAMAGDSVGSSSSNGSESSLPPGQVPGGKGTLPGRLALHTSATCRVRVTNNTDRTMPLSLRWRLPRPAAATAAATGAASGGGGGAPALATFATTLSKHSTSSQAVATASEPLGVVPHGACWFDLGPVGRGGGMAECTLEMLAVRPGWHAAGLGLVVVDESTGREYAQPALGTLVVLPLGQKVSDEDGNSSSKAQAASPPSLVVASTYSAESGASPVASSSDVSASSSSSSSSAATAGEHLPPPLPSRRGSNEFFTPNATPWTDQNTNTEPANWPGEVMIAEGDMSTKDGSGLAEGQEVGASAEEAGAADKEEEPAFSGDATGADEDASEDEDGEAFLGRDSVGGPPEPSMGNEDGVDDNDDGLDSPHGAHQSAKLVDIDESNSNDDTFPEPPPMVRQTTGGNVHGDESNDYLPDAGSNADGHQNIGGGDLSSEGGNDASTGAGILAGDSMMESVMMESVLLDTSMNTATAADLVLPDGLAEGGNDDDEDTSGGFVAEGIAGADDDAKGNVEEGNDGIGALEGDSGVAADGNAEVNDSSTAGVESTSPEAEKEEEFKGSL